jgi:transposase
MTRERLVRRRTQTLNQIHKILRRRNLEWERPTKTFQTVKVRQWLKTLELDPIDRSAMNQLLVQWALWDEQLLAVEGWIRERFLANQNARLLATIPGVSMFIGLAIACRIAPIARFPRGRSLANFLGLTPGCNSSGDTERVGSITKIGSRMVRYLLAQAIQHLLRRDGGIRAWFQRIKRRRGSKVARVAVMRRLAVIMWRMLSTGESWRRSSEIPVADSEPRQADAPQNKQAEDQPGDTGLAGLSTGASSLLAGEEVTPCLA